jgi:hypothetical protein
MDRLLQQLALVDEKSYGLYLFAHAPTDDGTTRRDSLVLGYLLRIRQRVVLVVH